jgi:xylonate dehydratase
VRDGDVIEIEINQRTLVGRVNLVETADGEKGDAAVARFLSRSAHPELRVEAEMPDDTRLWAALQQVGGGAWGGCVYDVDEIIATLEAGIAARKSGS